MPFRRLNRHAGRERQDQHNTGALAGHVCLSFVCPPDQAVSTDSMVSF